MSVLIFGGCGMIGSYVASDLCARGIEVITFDRVQPPRMLAECAGSVRSISGDVGDAQQVRAAVEESKARRILHLAAVLGRACEQDPSAAMRINVQGTVNVLEAARNCAVERLVYASSGEVYGRGDRVRHEELAFGPQISIYAATKILGERLGARYAELGGFTFVALRFGLTFGPATITSPGEAMMIQTIEQTMNGSSVVVPEVSGNSRRQLAYVRDAAAAAVAALNHPKPSYAVYNVSGPTENYVTLEEFHRIAQRLAPNAGGARFMGPEKQLGPMDTTRICEDLGFVPAFSIEAGLRARIEDRRRWWP